MGANQILISFLIELLDKVKWIYLVVPISSIKGEPDGQEGLQHHCLLGNPFSCTKTSQHSVNIFQYIDIQLFAGKAFWRGRSNFDLSSDWAYLDEVKWIYLVIPISSIKGEPDGQEGLQHHCLLGNSFSCTKKSQQPVNLFHNIDF